MLINQNTSPKTLRKTLRQVRRSLSTYQQQLAAKRLVYRLAKTTAFKNAKKIGLYQASDGEINPKYLLKLAHAQGKSCYLPVLRRFPKFELGFIKVSPSSRLHRHRFGMKEPKYGRKLFIYQLDMVCMPLVGFDSQCHRLGMGGGFYDRSLARHKNPKLIKLGLAHDCQQVDVLVNQHWDVSLDGVITPTHYWQAP
ncbi:MAG: 5-formyltetrahydrofolate cyclo-ligase [Agitococcus sp.]|nr:5-formyltetrahydrofolate cyclo-ligase [Agitococcus sp.]